MLFNSLAFGLFLPLVLLVHFLLPAKARWIGMLVAGHVFYMAFVPWYVLLLWGAILLDWTLALGIVASDSPRRRRLLLWASVAGTCSLLLVFKYAGLFTRMAQPLASALHIPVPLVELVLPIGLSFHTFQSLAYVIEVYHDRAPAERHLGRYALYVLFFPQLVAGPIERPQNLLPQLSHFPDFDPDAAIQGLRRMAWGFFLKVGVADRIAPVADAAFAQPSSVSSLAMALGVLAFCVQIYCDFLGYTEIARGAAQMLGIRLIPNFDRPWRSMSPSLYWRRWHMSLSSWFRDYVYIALGGNRKGRLAQAAFLLVTFGLSGLWHGAGAGFVLWGLVNGLWLVLEHLLLPRHRQATGKLGQVLSWAVTMVLVVPTWILFRAPDLPTASLVAKSLIAFTGESVTSLLPALHLAPTEAALCLAGAFTVALVHHATQGDPARWLEGRSAPVRWGATWAVLFFLLFCGALEGQRFVYFQF